MRLKIESKFFSSDLESECNILEDKVSELRKKIDTAKKEQEETKAVSFIEPEKREGSPNRSQQTQNSQRRSQGPT